MPYYSFDRCPEASLEAIAELCSSIGLLESRCEAPNRQWQGKRDFSIEHPIILVNYVTGREHPLCVQTIPKINYSHPPVLDFLKRIVAVTQATQVYENFYPKVPLDMAVFS